MATVWHGIVNPLCPDTVREWRYGDQEITLQKGEEMGRFLLGPTVEAVLFEACAKRRVSVGD